jgi:hypothetical protein
MPLWARQQRVNAAENLIKKEIPWIEFFLS